MDRDHSCVANVSTRRGSAAYLRVVRGSAGSRDLMRVRSVCSDATAEHEVKVCAGNRSETGSTFVARPVRITKTQRPSLKGGCPSL